PSLNYLLLDYAYFGRAELWSNEAVRPSDPNDITENKLRADRLLMADAFFRWSVNGKWSFNHGLGGAKTYAANILSTGSAGPTGPPTVAGMNELFGDGHVIWKNRGDFDLPLMDQ